MSAESPIAVCCDFDVLYEDDDVLVVSKAAPLLMHPTRPGPEPTLWHGVREFLAYELACGGQVSFINRLDRETSGIVLIAKTPQAAGALGRAMQARQLEKEYLAIVVGRPDWESACCAEPLRRMEEVAPTRVHVRQCCHPGGKPSQTTFQVLQRKEAHGSLPPLSLVRCRPRTGRMHQIRAHLAYLGFPLLGDKIYGGDESCYLDFMASGWTAELSSRLHLPRHALHASLLRFPAGGGMREVQSPLPADLAALLD